MICLSSWGSKVAVFRNNEYSIQFSLEEMLPGSENKFTDYVLVHSIGSTNHFVILCPVECCFLFASVATKNCSTARILSKPGLFCSVGH